MATQYQVAGFDLYFPDDHLLAQYQTTWHLYDRALGPLTQAIATKYPQMTAIDIGANVGDSAALIQQFQPLPTLCVEGNPEYLEYLAANAEIISNITIADCFIGATDAAVALEAIASQGGTTSVVDAVGVDGLLLGSMRTLEGLVQDFPQFQTAKLLKIDTDGFDFAIIQSAHQFIAQAQPILYFEYDIAFAADGRQQALATIDLLVQLGYAKFAIYDNFGNHLITLSGGDRQLFFDLTNYLYSSRYASGQPVIYYFDICAFPAADLDLCETCYPADTWQ